MTTLSDDIAAPPSSHWDDDLWEALLASIAKGRVIPVIGPALSIIEVDGRRLTFDRFVAEQLAGRLSLSAAEISPGPSLDAVVSAHLRRQGRLEDLYPKINAIVAGHRFEPPEALLKLARISHLRLFVTTATDSLIESALSQVRPGAIESIGYVPSEMPDCDIRQNLRHITTPTVYHLLGKVSALPEYVICEDDTLEYVVALQSDKQPVNLFDDLMSHYLLVLGDNFSDWLLRLFLRMAKRQRLSDPRRPMGDREILADEHSRGDAALVGFLTNFSPQTKIFGGDAVQFIDELHRRWTERFSGVELAPVKSEKGAIFLSYAREDVIAARAVKAGLEAEHFQVWFDEGEMVGGEDFDYRIANEINSCAVFVALISSHTENDLRDAYFRREWYLAGERDTRNSDRAKFIVPVVVDDTPLENLREVPARFLRKHILVARDGAVSKELIGAIKAALDQRI